MMQLLKHDMRQMNRLMMRLFLLFAASVLITWIIRSTNGGTTGITYVTHGLGFEFSIGSFKDMLFGGNIVILILESVLIVIATFIYSVYLFTKELSGDSSKLFFSIAMPSWKIAISKIFSGSVFVGFSILIFVASARLLDLWYGEGVLGVVFSIETVVAAVETVAILFLMSIYGICPMLAGLYLAITISKWIMHTKHNRWILTSSIVFAWIFVNYKVQNVLKSIYPQTIDLIGWASANTHNVFNGALQINRVSVIIDLIFLILFVLGLAYLMEKKIDY